MVTSEVIREPRHQTSASCIDATHALSGAQGNMEQAIPYLHSTRVATKALHVAGSELAARMAAALIPTGMWFECEQLDREKWHFAVAPAGYGRLVALHGALLCSQNTSEV